VHLGKENRAIHAKSVGGIVNQRQSYRDLQVFKEVYSMATLLYWHRLHLHGLNFVLHFDDVKT